MDSEEIRLIIWGTFGCLGFMLFLLILKSVSKMGQGDADQHSSQAAGARKKIRNPMTLRTERSAVVVPTILRDMSLDKLKAATDEFNALNLIKIGRSGDFFVGVLDGEEQIVVKRMSAVGEFKSHDHSDEQPPTEVEIYTAESTVNRYLVPLLGQCYQGDYKLLVYKFISKGDLASALARGRGALASDDTSPQSLPWIIRLKIAVEAAEALLHLHYHCHPPILHQDIRSSSILLTDSFEVRLGSLSCAQKVDNGEMLRYDIFCFGKVLLDLISGLDVSGSEDPYAEAWVIKALPYIDSNCKDGFLALIDPSLVVEEDFTKEILGVAALAKACLDPSSLKSLNMKIVRQVLHSPQHFAKDLSNRIGN